MCRGAHAQDRLCSCGVVALGRASDFWHGAATGSVCSALFRLASATTQVRVSQVPVERHVLVVDSESEDDGDPDGFANEDDDAKRQGQNYVMLVDGSSPSEV